MHIIKFLYINVHQKFYLKTAIRKKVKLLEKHQAEKLNRDTYLEMRNT